MKPDKIYREDGSLMYEEWYDKEGHRHREDGPAWIYYYKDGVTINREYWCKHGKWHRLDGPAVIWYDEDGGIKLGRWFIDDEELTKDKVLAYKRNLTINKLTCK